MTVRERRRLGPRAVVVAGLAALALAAGCDRGSDPRADPADFETYRGAGFSFVHPRGWRVLGENERFQRDATVEVAGPEVTRRLPPLVRVNAGPQPTDFDTTVRLAKGFAGLASDREVLRDEDATVEGATRAVLVEDRIVQHFLDGKPVLTAPLPEEGTDDPVQVRQVFVVAEGPDRTGLLLQVVVPEREYDGYSDAVRTIVESFKVETAPAGG